MFGKKKAKYDIDLKTADQMLQNIFAACDTTPNRVPFDKIVLRSKQNLIAENLLIIISSILFLISFVAPLFFPHADAFLSVASPSRQIELVDHQMNEDSFQITFGGQALDIKASYMEGEDGHIVYAEKYDRFSNTIVFPYIPIEYNIYVYDMSCKGIHLLLTPHDY